MTYSMFQLRLLRHVASQSRPYMSRKCLFRSQGGATRGISDDILGHGVKDDMSKEQLRQKDDMSKEHLRQKDDMSKDQLRQKEDISKDQLRQKDDISKDQLRQKDDMSKDQLRRKEDMSKTKGLKELFDDIPDEPPAPDDILDHDELDKRELDRRREIATAKIFSTKMADLGQDKAEGNSAFLRSLSPHHDWQFEALSRAITDEKDIDFLRSLSHDDPMRALLSLAESDHAGIADAINHDHPKIRKVESDEHISRRASIAETIRRAMEKDRKEAQLTTWAPDSSPAIRKISIGPAHRAFHHLMQRGYIKDIAGPSKPLATLLDSNRPIHAYAGIDPTASSLHLGHLLPFMLLFWLQIHGHHAISLIGTATASVGDPTGRLSSRQQMADTTRTDNANSMRQQLVRLRVHARELAAEHGYFSDPNAFSIVDNSTWLNKLTVVEFLQVLGQRARMGTMMGRDTVRNKMSNGDGMSFAEFTYPLLQAWDWWHLYDTQKAQIQIGGSDQYGNIVAGIDAIKSIKQHIADDDMPYGITTPLLTTASGEKFGKSAGNAVWLDPDLTSPFDLYAHLLRTPDTDVQKYLLLFTFIPVPNIDAIMEKHKEDPSRRLAQHRLATQLVALVHGPEVGEATKKKHKYLRTARENPTIASLLASQQAQKPDAKDETGEECEGTRRGEEPYPILPRSLVFDRHPSQIVYHAGLSPSIQAARKQIAERGIYAGLTTADGDMDTSPVRWLAFDNTKNLDVYKQMLGQVKRTGLLVLRSGKLNVKVVKVVEDAEAKELWDKGWWRSKTAMEMLEGIEGEKRDRRERHVRRQEDDGPGQDETAQATPSPSEDPSQPTPPIRLVQYPGLQGRTKREARRHRAAARLLEQQKAQETSDAENSHAEGQVEEIVKVQAEGQVEGERTKDV